MTVGALTSTLRRYVAVDDKVLARAWATGEILSLTGVEGTPDIKVVVTGLERPLHLGQPRYVLVRTQSTEEMSGLAYPTFLIDRYAEDGEQMAMLA